MADPTITNLDQGSVVLLGGDLEFRDEALTFPGVDTYLEGTILARKSVADAITAGAFVGTGDGTVSAASVVAGDIPVVGAYNLEMISAAVANGTATAAAVADGGNTGDGTVTAVTVTADSIGLIPGAYNLECTELGVKNGTAVGTATADGGNTGDGTAGAVVAGSSAIAGDYIVTCITAVGNGGVFSVIDPNGVRLEDLTVAVAYSNSHFGVTIADGAADFIVGDFWTIAMTETGGLFKLEDPNGALLKSDIVMDAAALAATVIEVEGLNFTITDGATSFIVGDKFAVTVANTGGIFKLVDPNGATVSNSIIMDAGALAATVIEVSGMTFTITDGATDFVVGDAAPLTVVADGKMVIFAVAGVGGAQTPMSVLTYAITSTGAGDVQIRAMKAGRVVKERLVIDGSAAGVGITDAILDSLQNVSIVAQDVQELAGLDNQ